ncbi:MAG: NAD(P)H-quinone oxidoreductase subunit L [Pseudanabaenaceae cyanobacterium]
MNWTDIITNPWTIYAIIAGLYLVVVPVILMYYFRARWYKTGAIERAFICFMVFFFFVGLLLVSPFLNFRPPERKIA